MAEKQPYWFLTSFADTAQEWHYLAAGFTTGFALGLYVGGKEFVAQD